MIIKLLNIMNNFIQYYKIILKHLQELDISFECFKQIRSPKLSNLEVVCINITAEHMSIDSKCQIFRLIESTVLNGKIERNVYNRRKRRLFPYTEKVGLKLAQAFNLVYCYQVKILTMTLNNI